MLLILLALLALIANPSYGEIIEENGSLLEFFSGHEENCAYDNWLSHISEGIARAGYNDYGPVELDRQTNGFGAYQIVDSLQNPDDILQAWYKIFANIYAGEIDTASAILDNSSFSDLYEIVLLQDQDEEYVVVREVLDNGFFDDNGTEAESDNVTGSFRYGWGIYIFNRNPRTPEVVLEVPHPCDDFIAPHIAMDTFIRLGTAALFVTGAGREIKWSNVGAYDNSRSRSDPTRVGNRSAFNEAHKVVVDSICNEFVIPIHSYDSGARDLSQILIACYPDNRPGRPILDWDNHYDILHLTPLYPIAANSIGNEDHPAVRIDEYYAIWEDPGIVYYNYEYRISNELSNLVGWPSPQRSYSTDHPDTLNPLENYMHIEHDEFPDMIAEELLSFYPPGGVPTYRTYANIVEFARPLYNAIDAFYHRPRSHTVPDDFAGIQAAIDGSYGGDTIIVRPGIYNESINFQHKNIQLTSFFGISNDFRDIDSTIIEGDNSSVVTFAGYESLSAKLVGFTIRGGRSLDGAGIFMNRSRPIIDHCVITGNIADGFGGGVFCGNSTPVFNNCTITGNSAADGGGGIFAWNQTGLTISNSILTGNFPEQLSFFRLGQVNSISCSYSDVEGGVEGIETGNNVQISWLAGIDADPLFLDPINGNFHLSPFSPCVDAGSPQAPYDPDSTIADMGAFPIKFRNIVVTPGKLDFADYEIGVLDSLSVTIHNLGFNIIRLFPRRISPQDSPFFIHGHNGEVVLMPDSSLEVWVTFSPQDSGEHRADLLIVSDQEGEELTRVRIRATLLGVDEPEIAVAEEFKLYGAYPNPFNSMTTIRYSVGLETRPARLLIYDLSGRLVADLLPGKMPVLREGERQVVWGATDLSAGVYFCRLEAGNLTTTQKLLLVR